MMNENLIKTLPDSVCWRIASKLDSIEKPNWKSLISKMPKNTYNEKDVNRFHMSILGPRGSPTIDLLVDLGKKKKTIGQFIQWLTQLEKFPDLVDLLVRGEDAVKQSAPTIIVQPQSDTYETGKEAQVTFEVRGDPPLKYQWYKGMITLQDQRQNCLFLSDLRLQDSGYYTCCVANEFGYIYSDWVKIDVCDFPYPESFNAPLITMHPRSVTCEIGQTIHLYSDAVGNPAPHLQWFRDSERLLGKCDRDLIIPSASPDEHEGLYHLHASNKHGSVKSLSSQVTIVKPSNGSPVYQPVDSYIPDEKYPRGAGIECNENGYSLPVPNMPSEKIALLIGNENYLHRKELGQLVHPVNDTHDVAVALMQCGFKVVSLVNLDLKAMNDALKFFYDLLGQGTYSVFYFAGHGFEIDGESYLMPVDASNSYTPTENLALSDVMLAMTTKGPKLSVLLLDCCRTKPEYCRLDPIPKLCHRMVVYDENDRTQHVQRKNVIIGFGCCSQGRVLESPLMKNGYFAKSLAENIIKDIKIDDVLFEVSKEIHRENIIDPDTGRTQVVYRHSTVVDDLKLTDKSEADLSVKLSDKGELWKQAHIAPDSPVTILQNDFVTVKLSFTAEFSNSLLIHSNVVKSPNTTACDIMFILPQSIGGATVEIKTPEEKGMADGSNFVRISNLERLDKDITIHVEVTYEVNGERHQQHAFYEIKEKPLYAKIIEQVNLSRLKLKSC